MAFKPIQKASRPGKYGTGDSADSMSTSVLAPSNGAALRLPVMSICAPTSRDQRTRDDCSVRNAMRSRLNRLIPKPTVMRWTVFASYALIDESCSNRARRARANSALEDGSAHADAMSAGVTSVERFRARDESLRVLSLSRALIFTKVPWDPD